VSELAISDISIGYPVHSGNGIASESEILEKLLDLFIENLKTTESIGRFSELQNTLDELTEILKDCSQDNWDGYNAKPVSIDTYLEANDIIRNLNTSFSNFPMPEILPEPDGDIAFEWNDQWGRSFVFSIDDNKTITYAGIFGPNKAHGTEIYRGFIPRAIVDYLRRLYP